MNTAIVILRTCRGREKHRLCRSPGGIARTHSALDRERPGHSLIEMLTVIGIVGLMLSITCPAIQNARESARRVQCANNLKQMGVALNSHMAARGTAPPTIITGVNGKTHPVHRWFSPHVHLLPFLEAHSIADMVDLSGFCMDELTYPGMDSNRTAMGQQIELFLCPSDFRANPWPIGGNSYRACEGVGVWHNVKVGDNGNGLFRGWNGVRPAEVTDGMSNTAAFSEKLRGDGDPLRYSPDADFHWVAGRAYRQGPASPGTDWYLRRCGVVGSANPSHYSSAGGSWFFSGTKHTLYTHADSPNSTTPDCGDIGYEWPPGIFTARSAHPGGVNVVFGDGSTRFVSDGVDRALWRSLGSIDGGEHGEF